MRRSRTCRSLPGSRCHPGRPTRQHCKPVTFLLFGALLAACRWGLRPVPVIAIFISAPAILAFNAPRMDLQVFTWVKVLTLAASMLLIVSYPLVRTEAWQRRLAACVTAILALNIVEAVVADAVAGHWLNPAVGTSLIVTLAWPRAFSPSADGRHMLYDIGWPWILGYTAWNLTVVCGLYPEHWTDHLAVLAVPLVVAWLWGRERWLEARALSLALYAVGIVLVIDVFRLPWLPTPPSPAELYPWLSGLAALLAVWNLLPSLLRRRPGKLAA